MTRSWWYAVVITLTHIINKNYIWPYTPRHGIYTLNVFAYLVLQSTCIAKCLILTFELFDYSIYKRDLLLNQQLNSMQCLIISHFILFVFMNIIFTVYIYI